jgi:hypothetical protein
VGRRDPARQHLRHRLRLPDHDLSGLGKDKEDYGLDLSQEAPICQKDAAGRFTTPLPDEPGAE